MSNFGLLRGRCTVEGVFTIRGCSVHSLAPGLRVPCGLSYWCSCLDPRFSEIPNWDTIHSFVLCLLWCSTPNPFKLLLVPSFTLPFRRQVEVSSWFCALRCSAILNQNKAWQPNTKSNADYVCACLCGLEATQKIAAFDLFFNRPLISSIKWMVSMCALSCACPVPRLCCAFNENLGITKRVCFDVVFKLFTPRPLQNTVLVEYSHSWCSRSETRLSGFFLLIWISLSQTVR